MRRIVNCHGNRSINNQYLITTNVVERVGFDVKAAVEILTPTCL